MASEPINIPIKTTYDDGGAKDALADVEKLDQAEPEIEVTADTKGAVSDIEQVEGVAQDLLDRNPWVAEMLADTGAAKADLESLQGKLIETGDKSEDAKRKLDKIGGSEGPRLAGNQVADLTGPLGDASGAASNLGGVFDGLADITEKVAGKVGLDAAKMAGAVSGIGFAVAAGAAAWTLFRQKQAEAKKKAEEHLKVQTALIDAIKDGNKAVAAAKFEELYGDVIDKGTRAGLSINEVVDAITGSGDAAAEGKAKIKDLDASIADLTTQYEALHSKTQASGEAAGAEEKKIGELLVKRREERDALVEATGMYSDLTEEQQTNIDKQDAIQGALFNTTSELNDAATAADAAKQKTDNLSAAYDTLKGHLDIKRTMEDFETDVTTAMNNIALGIPPTRDEIRTIEDTIVEVGDYADLNPIEVESLLQAANNGDMFTVLNTMQGVVDNYGALEVEVIAKANAAQLQAQLRGFQSDMNAQFGNKPKAGGTAASTTVNVNLPRGARHGDIARAMNLSTRRNGRRYGNPSGTVQYARSG